MLHGGLQVGETQTDFEGQAAAAAVSSCIHALVVCAAMPNGRLAELKLDRRAAAGKMSLPH
jgi:hypothetical protein